MTDILTELGLDKPEERPSERAMTGIFTATAADVAVVKLVDGSEAIMPRNEFFENTQWQTGWQVAVILLGTDPRPVVSAVRPEVVSGLYLGVTPELRDGRVKIMSVARAAGDRTKIAVASTTEEIDAVGAMVGRKANRARLVSDRLRGERIDIIAWHNDPATFVGNALAPAKVREVRIDGDSATAVVDAHQMSAAVGSGGVNTLLASELTGFNVTIEAA